MSVQIRTLDGRSSWNEVAKILLNMEFLTVFQMPLKSLFSDIYISYSSDRQT